ncbi:hypothetical protein MMPV_007356 [Pyropia vietnamensis]
MYATEDPPPSSADADGVTLDVGNLTAFSHPTAIPLSTEEDMATAAATGIVPLFTTLLALPVVPSTTGGRVVALPAPSTVLPRTLPPPTPAPLTKWEAFARAKGITKKKRERVVWDEATNSFKARHGYKRVEKNPQSWIVPHKEGMGNADEGKEEPFAPRKAARRAAVEKNAKAAAANERRAGRAVMTTASRGKAKKGKDGKTRRGAAAPEALTALDVGTTIRQSITKRGLSAKGGRYVDKTKLAATFAVSQRATASAGRFDKRVEGEKVAPVRGRKRKFEPAIGGKAALQGERSRALGLADKVLAGY